MTFRLNSKKSTGATEINGKCLLFGARTEDTEKLRRCTKCKNDTPDLYALCTKESEKLLSTSTVVVNGVTKNVIMPGRVDGFGSIIKGEDVPVKEKPVTNKITRKAKEKVMTNENVAKTNKSGGAVGLAKKLLSEGKKDGDILAALIQYYIDAGRDAKKAKHNAQSALFNAKKKPTAKVSAPKVDAVVVAGKSKGVTTEVTAAKDAGLEVIESAETQVVDAGEEEIVDAEPFTDDDGNPLGTE
jgi:hypothetical protein